MYISKIYLPRPNDDNYPPEIVNHEDSATVFIQTEIINDKIFMHRFMAKTTEESKKVLISNKLIYLGVDDLTTIYKDFNRHSKELEECSLSIAIDIIFDYCTKHCLKDELGLPSSMVPMTDTQCRSYSYPDNHILDVLENIYTEQCTEPPLPMDVEKFRYYSCVHNLTESFNIFVFEGSHRLRCQTLHRSSIINIKIPPRPSFFIILHGHILYSDAPSKFEPSPSSFNYAKDCRLFCYLEKFHKEATTGSRKSERIRLQENNTGWIIQNYEEMDRINPSYSVCSHEENAICQICRSIDEAKNKTNYPFVDGNRVLNIECIYNDMLRRGKISEKGSTLIAGDLDYVGWEVYTGANINEETMVEIRNEIIALIYDHENGWRNIGGGSKSFNTTGFIESRPSNTRIEEMTYNINTTFNIILDTCIKTLPGFQYTKISSPKILINDRKVEEQNIHRDYECIKISNL